MFICFTVSPKFLKNLNNFFAEMEKQLDKNIKSFRTDRDDEYLSRDFNKYLIMRSMTLISILQWDLKRMMW